MLQLLDVRNAESFAPLSEVEEVEYNPGHREEKA